MTKQVTSVDGKTPVFCSSWVRGVCCLGITHSESQKGLQNRVTYGPRASHSCDWQVTLSGFLTKACHS